MSDGHHRCDRCGLSHGFCLEDRGSLGAGGGVGEGVWLSLSRTWGEGCCTLHTQRRIFFLIVVIVIVVIIFCGAGCAGRFCGSGVLRGGPRVRLGGRWGRGRCDRGRRRHTAEPAELGVGAGQVDAHIDQRSIQQRSAKLQDFLRFGHAAEDFPFWTDQLGGIHFTGKD